VQLLRSARESVCSLRACTLRISSCAHIALPTSQATEAGERLGRWKRREAALSVARAQREEMLLAKSGSWVTWQTLDDRIAKALNSPEKMF
jgi:hypothetical protein